MLLLTPKSTIAENTNKISLLNSNHTEGKGKVSVTMESLGHVRKQEKSATLSPFSHF